MLSDLDTKRCSVLCHDDCLRTPVGSASAADDPIAKMGIPVHYPRGAEIFGQERPAKYLYQVVTGAVRTFKVLADGRRQICAFYLPGDYFGLELGERHASFASAIDDVQCILSKRQMVTERAYRRRDVARQLLSISGKEVQNLRDQTLMLTKNAEARFAWFLLQLAHRTSSRQKISLPMPRRDIADYLGVTVETISRTIRKFEDAGWIKASNHRQIELKNQAALTALGSL